MNNIVTCLGSKDLITYIFQSKIFKKSNYNIYIIAKPFSIYILKIANYFLKINFKYINENELLDSIGISNFKIFILKYNPVLLKKTGWYKQQILKYAIHLIVKDDYIIIDADTFPTNIKFLTNLDQNTRFYSTYQVLHIPYEETFNKIFLLNVPKSNYNFVAEVFPVKIEVLTEMLTYIERKHKKNWYQAIIENVTTLYGFSEYQTYGKYQSYINYSMKITEFNTNRHFGKNQLSIFPIRNPQTEYVSFETYDYPEGIQKLYFFILYKPFFLFVKLFNV